MTKDKKAQIVVALPKRDETHLARRKTPLGGSQGGSSCDSETTRRYTGKAPLGVHEKGKEVRKNRAIFSDVISSFIETGNSLSSGEA